MKETTKEILRSSRSTTPSTATEADTADLSTVRIVVFVVTAIRNRLRTFLPLSHVFWRFDSVVSLVAVLHVVVHVCKNVFEVFPIVDFPGRNTM